MQLSVACNLILLGDRLDSDPTVDFLDKHRVNIIMSAANRQQRETEIMASREHHEPPPGYD